MKRVFTFSVAVVLATGACLQLGFAGNIPYRTALEKANVTLAEMKDGNREGLIIGNGDLYGLVWDRDGELFLRMTKNDVWDARVDTSKDGPLPRVDIAAGTVTGKRGGQPSWSDHVYPEPRCAVALRLGPVPERFRGHLDLERAVVEVGAESAPEVTLRILKDRNVLLVKSPHAVELEEITAETLPPAELGSTDAVEWLKMKMPGDIDYTGMEYAVAVATRGDLNAIALVTSWDQADADVLKSAISLASDTVSQAEANLVARHEQAWRDYWSRSGIALGDPELERWWYRMLYFAGTICSPGTYPVGIMPPLATDRTPWHADFHHNYNTWQCYLPLPGANHPELADPWVGYNNGMIPRYKNLAMETYGIEGVHLPISSFLHEPDPAVCKSVNKRQLSLLPWGLTIGLQGMTLQSMWQKYLYDQDVAYMEEKIYPYLRETARFYVNFMGLCKTDDDGKIRLGPSYSPEHGAPGIYNCPFDIAYVHYTFDAMIEAGSVLGVGTHSIPKETPLSSRPGDPPGSAENGEKAGGSPVLRGSGISRPGASPGDAALVEACRKFKAMLPDYPTASKASGDHIVVDWTGCEVGKIKTHNITVPASPVFPADQVTWFDDEQTKSLYRRTIEALNFRDANAHVMLNIARARLSMLEAPDKLKAWFTTRERANGLFEWVGHAHGVYMPEMIGIAGAINELLLQSVDNKIRLFPCWWKDKDASFSNLRTQGGFLVSAQYRNGEVVSAKIESTAGRQLQLLSPWKTIHVNGKKADLDEDGLVTLDTKPGQILLFSEAAETNASSEAPTETATNRTKQPDKVRARQIKDMKWGMFICWSFSTFSGREWTPTLDKDATYFKATGCDTDQWCQTARDAGMGYILFLAKHHDGFCLWDTETTEKKVTNSPLGIDVLAKLRKSCDRYGIKLALYFSEGDWNWPNAVDGKGGINKQPGRGENPEVKKAQLKELLTRYGPIEFWWMDGAAGYGGLSHAETIRWMHTFQPDTFIGGNQGAVGGRINLRERGRPGPIGDANAVVHAGHLSSDYSGFLVAEFTYPILPKHQGGAHWFYSLPKHDNLVHPAEKLYADYVGAQEYGNIFSINIGPNYEGRVRDVDVKTLKQVGEMIRAGMQTSKEK